VGEHQGEDCPDFGRGIDRDRGDDGMDRGRHERLPRKSY